MSTDFIAYPLMQDTYLKACKKTMEPNLVCISSQWCKRIKSKQVKWYSVRGWNVITDADKELWAFHPRLRRLFDEAK